MLSCLDSPACCIYRAVPWLLSYFRLQLVFSICQLERSQLFSYAVITMFPQGNSQTFSSLLPSQHVISSALRCPHHIGTRMHIRHMTPALWTTATHHLTQFMVSHTPPWKQLQSALTFLCLSMWTECTSQDMTCTISTVHDMCTY